MAHYTEIDSKEFEAYLTSIGFKRTVHRNEVVFEKQSRAHLGAFIKVYSSSGVGEASARDVGKDAIRIVAVFIGGDGKIYPLFSLLSLRKHPQLVLSPETTLSALEYVVSPHSHISSHTTLLRFFLSVGLTNVSLPNFWPVLSTLIIQFYISPDIYIFIENISLAGTCTQSPPALD